METMNLTKPKWMCAIQWKEEEKKLWKRVKIKSNNTNPKHNNHCTNSFNGKREKCRTMKSPWLNIYSIIIFIFMFGIFRLQRLYCVTFNAHMGSITSITKWKAHKTCKHTYLMYVSDIYTLSYNTIISSRCVWMLYERVNIVIAVSLNRIHGSYIL